MQGETYKDCISIKIVVLPTRLEGHPRHSLAPLDGLLGGEPHQAVPESQGEAGHVHGVYPPGLAGAVRPVQRQAVGGELGAAGGA